MRELLLRQGCMKMFESFDNIVFIEDKITGCVGKITDISQEDVLKNGRVGVSLVTDEGDIIEKFVSLDDIKNITEEEFDERVDTILSILNVKISRIYKLCYASMNAED